MSGVVGGYANVNVSRSGHVLTGIVVIFETRTASGNRMLHYYGTGKGFIQNDQGEVGQTVGRGMNRRVWRDHVKTVENADARRGR
jgi:hypothetical protein